MIGEYAKAGFGITLGGIGAMAIAIILGLALFIPGFVIVNLEQKKPKDKQRLSMKVIGYVMMCLGVALGLGIGAGSLLTELGSEF
jgi:hypothetical protein